ncbi:hypothetical protein CHS0354_008333 [Potamilus streckersoni]|uniref:Cytochrome P450 n=1 Tax=Potamilus streckersoni TaxID=2493646 RepID=A0AAE0SDD9_9BIVA|nr:hypothetical protein CHS0354_008333 [Potamilus streckersoni]
MKSTTKLCQGYITAGHVYLNSNCCKQSDRDIKMLAVWLAVIAVFLFVLYSYITSLKNLTRGPSGWPVFGCLFQLEPSRLHFSFDRWAKKYGPLILCKMAATNLFVISCPRLIKKAFAEKGYSDILNDRPDTFFAKYIMDDSKGVVFGKYGQTFIRLRKIMYKGLNLYGEGVQHFENMANKELERLMKSITDLGGRDVNPKELLSRSLANMIGILDTYVPGRERGLVDVLFKIQSQEKNVGDTQWLTDSQVKGFIQDIIFAGLITTRNGLLCILLVLLHHHKCVDRMYQEIVDTVGLERTPSLKDKPAMPYTDAVILESLRYVTHAPIAAPHCAMEDVELEGYTIPKGSRVIMNIWTVHHDPAIWGDPWIFRPERFLDDNGELLPAEHTMRQSLVTFGSGKRVCVGENLAKSRLFLYLTTLIQKFDLRLPKEGTVPSDDSRTFLPGAVLRPQDFKMRFRVR